MNSKVKRFLDWQQNDVSLLHCNAIVLVYKFMYINITSIVIVIVMSTLHYSPIPIVRVPLLPAGICSEEWVRLSNDCTMGGGEIKRLND